jgi:Holliday junction resolvase RusA-like endonuclease
MSMDATPEPQNLSMVGKSDSMLFESLPLIPKPASDAVPAEEITLLFALCVEGDPVAKGRPRVKLIYQKGKTPYQKGKQIPMLYPPKETADYEALIAAYARRTIAAKPHHESKFFPYDEKPLGMVVRVYVRIPVSWPQKDKAAALRGEIFPLSRPDSDNYAKLVFDALNGIVYRDDALITDMHVIKRYSARPRIEIEVFV